MTGLRAPWSLREPTPLARSRARIAETEPRLRAWVELNFPADGRVPLGVKDIIDVAGFPTRCGRCCARTRGRPQSDAAIVTAWRAAGAVPVGKTVTTEFAYFSPGPTDNPSAARPHARRLVERLGGRGRRGPGALGARLPDRGLGHAARVVLRGGVPGHEPRPVPHGRRHRAQPESRQPRGLRRGRLRPGAGVLRAHRRARGRAAGPSTAVAVAPARRAGDACGRRLRGRPAGRGRRSDRRVPGFGGRVDGRTPSGDGVRGGAGAGDGVRAGLAAERSPRDSAAGRIRNDRSRVRGGAAGHPGRTGAVAALLESTTRSSARRLSVRHRPASTRPATRCSAARGRRSACPRSRCPGCPASDGRPLGVQLVGCAGEETALLATGCWVETRCKRLASVER